ncbi:hypothetical protein [Ekhidna sp.]|uniref:hypothetical protein n=1 Tax=Ekhidna sp. TaxID=2608089 RepID=UPI003C79A9AE
MKKYFTLLLFVSFLIFIGCGSEDEPDTSEVNIDISGEYEGVLQLSSGPERGIVLYRFVSKGDNVYTGFYEGNEFAEVTVTGNTITGVPSNGNTAFATMTGTASEDGIGYIFLDDTGTTEASFSGDKIDSGTRATAHITLDGNGYVQVNDPLSQCSNTSASIFYYRVGDLAWKASFVITCGENITAGTYPIGAGLFDATISVNMSYQGESFNSSSGNVVVTGNTDTSLVYDFTNVQWELSFEGSEAPAISGEPTCIY